MDASAELVGLQHEVLQLRREIDALRSGETPTPTPSRRQMLKLAAAGGIASVLGTSSSAAAAIGDPLKMGVVNDSQASTELRYRGTTSLAHHVIWVHDGGRLAGYPEDPFPRTAAISGWSTGLWVQDGINGVSEGEGYGGNFEGKYSSTDPATGQPVAATGIRVRGQRSTMLLVARPSSSIAANFAREPGEVLFDSAGDLWVCVVAGNPGTWRKLAGPAAAGAFHAVDPTRAYDSRVPQPAPGLLASGDVRTLTMRNGRTLDTGSISVTDLVPAGATAVTFNLAVVDTVGAGFLTVNSGGDSTIRSASINWSASGQVLANALVVKLNANREISVICGGGGSTNFVIDVLGYYR